MHFYNLIAKCVNVEITGSTPSSVFGCSEVSDHCALSVWRGAVWEFLKHDYGACVFGCPKTVFKWVLLFSANAQFQNRLIF